MRICLVRIAKRLAQLRLGRGIFFCASCVNEYFIMCILDVHCFLFYPRNGAVCAFFFFFFFSASIVYPILVQWLIACVVCVHGCDQLAVRCLRFHCQWSTFVALICFFLHRSSYHTKRDTHIQCTHISYINNHISNSN